MKNIATLKRLANEGMEYIRVSNEGHDGPSFAQPLKEQFARVVFTDAQKVLLQEYATPTLKKMFDECATGLLRYDLPEQMLHAVRDPLSKVTTLVILTIDNREMEHCDFSNLPDDEKGAILNAAYSYKYCLEDICANYAMMLPGDSHNAFDVFLARLKTIILPQLNNCIHALQVEWHMDESKVKDIQSRARNQTGREHLYAIPSEKWHAAATP